MKVNFLFLHCITVLAIYLLMHHAAIPTHDHNSFANLSCIHIKTLDKWTSWLLVVENRQIGQQSTNNQFHLPFITSSTAAASPHLMSGARSITPGWRNDVPDVRSPSAVILRIQIIRSQSCVSCHFIILPQQFYFVVSPFFLRKQTSQSATHRRVQYHWQSQQTGVNAAIIHARVTFQQPWFQWVSGLTSPPPGTSVPTVTLPVQLVHRSAPRPALPGHPTTCTGDTLALRGENENTRPQREWRSKTSCHKCQIPAIIPLNLSCAGTKTQQQQQQNKLANAV